MRALYEVDSDSFMRRSKLFFEVSPSPAIIQDGDVVKTFRFETAKKQFLEIPKHYAMDNATDALEIARSRGAMSKLKSILRTNNH